MMLFKLAAVVLLVAVAVAANQSERLSESIAQDVKEALGVQENPSDFVTEVPHSYFRGEHSLISAADSISHGFASAAEERAYGELPAELVESSNPHEMTDAAYTDPIDPAFLLEQGSVQQQVDSLEAIEDKAAHDAQEFDLGLIQTEEEIEPSAGATFIAPEVAGAPAAAPAAAAPAAPAAAPAPKVFEEPQYKPEAPAAPAPAPVAAPAATGPPKKTFVVQPDEPATASATAPWTLAPVIPPTPPAPVVAPQSEKLKSYVDAEIRSDKPAAAPAVAPKPKAPVAPPQKRYLQPTWKAPKAKRSRKSRRRAPKRKVQKPRPGQRVLVNTPSGPVYVLYVAKKTATAKDAKAAAPKAAKKAAASKKAAAAPRRRAIRKRKSPRAIAKILKAADKVQRRRRKSGKRSAKKQTRRSRRSSRRARRAAHKARKARRAAQSAANLQYDPVTNTIIRHVHNHIYTRLPPPPKVWEINNGPSVADAEKWSTPDKSLETSASESTLQRAYLKLCKLQRALVNKWNQRQRKSAAATGPPSARHVLVKANLVRNKYRRASRNAKKQSRRQVNEASLLADKYARHLRHYAKAQRILASASQRLAAGTSGRKAGKGQTRAQSQRARGCKRARHPKTGRRGWMCPKGTKAPRRAAKKAQRRYSSRVVFDRAAAAKKAGVKASPRFAQLHSEIALGTDAETEATIAAAHEAESFTQSLSDAELMHEAEVVAEDADVALAVANKKLEDSQNEEMQF